MTRERKENITIYSAVCMLIFGCTLTSIGFFIEPRGEVHDSVLWVLGQCLVYAGSALGIAAYATRIRHEVNARFEDFERRHNRHKIADDETQADTNGEEG